MASRSSSTHYLEEADELADRVAVLDRGRLIAEGTPDELKRLIPGGSVRLEFADAERLGSAAATFPAGTRDDDALTLQIPSDGGIDALRDVLDRLDERRSRSACPCTRPISTKCSSP